MDLDAVRVEPHGWLLIEEFSVRVRFAELGDGRFVPVGVEMLDSPITLRGLQQIPFGRIEAAANTSAVASILRMSSGHARFEGLDDRAAQELVDLREPEEEANVLVTALLAAKPTRYGDDFYQAFGRLYELEATRSDRPGAALAERLGVPVGRVWRWVRVSRSKGYLAPARVGTDN